MTANSFEARSTLGVDDLSYEIYRLDAFDTAGHLPYSLKVLLENLLRNEDGHLVTAEQISALAAWAPTEVSDTEIQFTPARVLMQDFTGVPCVVDLVAMREAMTALGGDPGKINPLVPTELVIDHSVIADVFGRPDASRINADLEFSRNKERYQLLRWAQQAFDDFQVVPPDTGICHQVNLEYLARVVFTRQTSDGLLAYPDTLVGTDSHTPMVNGLGCSVGGSAGSRRRRDARTADELADPAGARVQADRRAGRGGHRHRPGPHDRRVVAQDRGGRQVRRVLRPRRGERAAGKSGHDRQHEPRIRFDLRDFPH